MDLPFLREKKEIIGVDLGTDRIKLLELNTSKGKIGVVNFAQADISLQKLDEKSPEEAKQTYISILKKLLESNKFTSKNAAVSISGSSVIVRFVEFPKMEESDLEKALQFEAEPHIPFDIQEVYMDTQIVRDSENKDQDTMDTVLVAGKKDTIQEKIDIIQKSGLVPSIIDVDAFAIENAYEYIRGKVRGKIIVFVNIGASTTNISIVEDGISKVVRDLYTAGNTFNKAIREKMRVSTQKALGLKHKYGLSGNQEVEHELPAEEKEGDNLADQIYKILYPVVRELNSEIQRSIDFFTGQQTSKKVDIEKIVLTGGSANLKGLPELITNNLKIPVEVFRPLQNADISGLKRKVDLSSPSLSVVAGLAIRKTGDHK